MKTSEKLETLINHLSNQPNGLLYEEEKNNILKNLKKKYKSCQECPLSKQGRKQVVFGEGNEKAELMFIGEGPGRDEDIKGIPFIGRAGQLLTKMIIAMGLTREEAYITNVVKCRPPNNRAPLPNESEACKKLMLKQEIEYIKPKIICTLGASATKAMLGDQIKISKARGQMFNHGETIIIPTFHPAYLLRNPHAKKDVWEDLKKIMAKLKSK